MTTTGSNAALAASRAIPARFMLHARLDFGPGRGTTLVPLLVLLHHADAAILNADRAAIITDISEIIRLNRDLVFSSIAGAGKDTANRQLPASVATLVFHGERISARFSLQTRPGDGGYSVLTVSSVPSDAAGAVECRAARVASWVLVARVSHKERDVLRARAAAASAATAAATAVALPNAASTAVPITGATST